MSGEREAFDGERPVRLSVNSKNAKKMDVENKKSELLGRASFPVALSRRGNNIVINIPYSLCTYSVFTIHYVYSSMHSQSRLQTSRNQKRRGFRPMLRKTPSTCYHRRVKSGDLFFTSLHDYIQHALSTVTLRYYCASPSTSCSGLPVFVLQRVLVLGLESTRRP